MLVVIDPALGAEAHHTAATLTAALGRQCTVFVGPSEAPDAGLGAALGASAVAIVEGAAPAAWLRGIEGIRVAHDGDHEALAARLAEATGLELKPTGGRAGKLEPVTAGALGEALTGLDGRWRIEVVDAPRLPQGLKAELVAEIACADHLAAADLARAVADIAETQDHHPTLVQAYRSLTVRVTTGEAAGRLTQRDITFAKAVDAAIAATQ